MAIDISVTRTGAATFEAKSSAEEARKFVQTVLSSVDNVALSGTQDPRITGLYLFGGGELVTFHVHILESSASQTRLELEFGDNEAEERRNFVQGRIAEVLCSEYFPQTSPSAQAIGAESATAHASSGLYKQGAAGASFDYKTKTALGSFFAIVGWIGVAISIIGALVALTFVGAAGLLVGFIAALGCLLTIATGQLLRAQAEVANNSRLILMHLERLGQSRG